jgi:hypothetical protein
MRTRWVRIKRGFGDAQRGVDAVGIQDDKREGVGVAVAEFAELFGEDDEAFARGDGGARKRDFGEECRGDLGEELALVFEVRVERHGLHVEFG